MLPTHLLPAHSLGARAWPHSRSTHWNYNTVPTQPIPVIRQSPKESIRELSLMRWGIIFLGESAF